MDYIYRHSFEILAIHVGEWTKLTSCQTLLTLCKQFANSFNVVGMYVFQFTAIRAFLVLIIHSHLIILTHAFNFLYERKPENCTRRKPRLSTKSNSQSLPTCDYKCPIAGFKLLTSLGCGSRYDDQATQKRFGLARVLGGKRLGQFVWSVEYEY